MENLKELVKYLKSGNQMEDLEDTNMERIGNMIYEDEDFNEFLRKIGSDIVYRSRELMILADFNTAITVTTFDRPNRFNSECGEETIIDFDTFEEIKILKEKSTKSKKTAGVINKNQLIKMANTLSELAKEFCEIFGTEVGDCTACPFAYGDDCGLKVVMNHADESTRQ